MSLQPSTGVGVRGHAAKVLKAAAVEDTAWMEEQLSQRDWEEQALASFRVRLNRAERDAVRLYFELRKMVGVHEEVMALALRALGVSLEVAKSAVDQFQQVEHLSGEALAEYGLAQLQAYYAPLGKRVVVLDAIEPGERGSSHGACDDPGSANGHSNGGMDANGSAATP